VFHFAFKNFLYLLILIPILIFFFIYAFRQKRKAMALFGNLSLVQKLSPSVSRSRQIWKAILQVGVVVLLIFTIARPQWGENMPEEKREGRDIMIALDVSLSMTAEDIQPNRLEKAKHEISSFMDKLKGDRIGLIAFSGKAFVQCPLTLDYGAAKMFLDIMEPDIFPVPGTAVAEAISKAMTSFVEKERKNKVLILITDGEDHIGKPVEAAKEAAKEGVVIYCVGIGSLQGVPIPLYDTRGNRIGFKKDRNDEVVMTKLDEVTLEKIAMETGGKYYRASPGEVELDKILDYIDKIDKKVLDSRQFVRYEDQFRWPLLFAMLLLVAEILLPERKRVKKEWRGRFE